MNLDEHLINIPFYPYDCRLHASIDTSNSTSGFKFSYINNMMCFIYVQTRYCGQHCGNGGLRAQDDLLGIKMN